MTQTFAVTSTRSSVSMRGSMSASTTKSRVWRCPNCQRKIDEAWERRSKAVSEFVGWFVVEAMKVGVVFGIAYCVKIYVFPHADARTVLQGVRGLLHR